MALILEFATYRMLGGMTIQSHIFWPGASDVNFSDHLTWQWYCKKSLDTLQWYFSHYNAIQKRVHHAFNHLSTTSDIAVYAKSFLASPDIWSFLPDIWLNLTAALRRIFWKFAGHVRRVRRTSHRLISELSGFPKFWKCLAKTMHSRSPYKMSSEWKMSGEGPYAR